MGRLEESRQGSNDYIPRKKFLGKSANSLGRGGRSLPPRWKGFGTEAAWPMNMLLVRWRCRHTYRHTNGAHISRSVLSVSENHAWSWAP